jgi:transposase
MENLPNDIEALKEIIRQLLEKNQRLEAENAELCRRLGMDSTNSHKPPSSEGYRKKTTQPGLPKKKGEGKGGQKGHKGKTLERVEKPDHVEVHLPKQCECCGRQFGTEEEYEIIQSRQVFDLPEPKLEVTEHRLGQITCCGKEQKGEYPLEVNTPVQYGAGVRALIVMLSVDCKMPLEQISQFFADIFGYKLNGQTILEVLERGYELSAPLEEQIKATLRESEVVHFDETGIRVEGKLRWLHTASTEENTHLYFHEKRGTEALNSKESILPEYRGIAVHDCWSPYFTFNQVKHALCGAHLLRELKSLIEEGSLWAQEMYEFLLDVYNMPNPVVAEEELRKHYQIILEHAEQEEPPPQQGKRGRPKKSRGRNLLDRLRTYQESVLAFAFEVGVPFTNNQAERDLRPSKVKLKICGGFRTIKGGVVYARIQALISTLRKRDMNVFAQLRDLFSLRLSELAYAG